MGNFCNLKFPCATDDGLLVCAPQNLNATNHDNCIATGQQKRTGQTPSNQPPLVHKANLMSYIVNSSGSVFGKGIWAAGRVSVDVSSHDTIY